MGDAYFIVIADFNIEGVKSEIVYAGPDEEYARNVNQIISDYPEGEFRSMMESVITTFRIEVWLNGNCITEAEELSLF